MFMGNIWDVCGDHVELDTSVKYDNVDKPYHYASHGLETIKKIEAIIDGLPAREAAMLANIIKYSDRAGLKNSAEEDLAKANNYAHRMVFGHWRGESDVVVDNKDSN